MPAVLLDVNLLMALAWSNHIHHEPAHRWFAGRGARKWATCPLTQLAFVRLSSQAVVVKTPITVQAALRTLDANLASDDHEFWPMERGFSEILSELRDGLAGHHQLADALLLDLAIRRSGTLATLDRRIAGLLPTDSRHRGAIELVPTV
jgi:toxin-antitoxin system PIN domain toxin